MKQLMAGVIGTEYYAWDDDADEVFLIDADGNKHKVSASLAKKVREAITRAESLNSGNGRYIGRRR
jgi:hypothetical protein